MENPIYDEIMRRVEALHLDATNVSRKAGFGGSYIRDLNRKGITDPHQNALTAIAKVLGCTAEDIRSGAAVVEPSATVSINELDVHVALGVSSSGDVGQSKPPQDAGAVVGTHVYPAKSFHEAHGIQPGHVRIIPVRGISMQPELWPGQRVMIDIQDRTPSPPGIFVIWDGLGLVLKYIEVIPNSDPLRVRLSSAHPAFMSYECMVDDAHINGRVVGVWKRL